MYLEGAQACGSQHPPNAPAAHQVALRVQLGPQTAGAVVGGMPGKLFLHRHFPGWRWGRHPVPLPGIVRTSRHAQHLADMTHGHLGPPLSDVAVGTHRFGWPKMTKAFLKYPTPVRCASTEQAAGALPGREPLPHAPHFGHKLGLLPAIAQLKANTQLLGGRRRAAALRSQEQGLSFKGIAVLAPFIQRGSGAFCGHDSGNIRSASVRLV